MHRRRSWSRLLYLLVAGLIVIAVALVYITAPEPTALTVRVVDLESARPLAGAQVQPRVPGEEPRPALVTDDTGEVRFPSLPAHPAYSVRVQAIDYVLAVESPVAVPAEQETVIVVALAHDPGHRLYVGLDRARLSVIDTASMRLVQTVVLPAAPEAQVRHLQLHPDGDLLYAVSGDQGHILSTKTGASRSKLDVEGSIDSLEVTADGRYVLAAGLVEPDPTGIMAQRHLWALDAQTGRLVTDTLLSGVSVGSDLAIAWQPSGHDAYILRATNAAVDRLATNGRADLPFSGLPLGITGRDENVILSADGQRLYWSAVGYRPDEGEFTLLATTALEDGATVFQELPAGVSALAASPVRQQLYVLNGALSTLTIIDLAGEEPRILIPAGKQPERLAVSPDGGRVYVADVESNAILVVDLDSASVTYILPLPGEPISLAAG